MEYRGFDTNFSLENKVALITGASRGIGFAVASLFAKKGATIVMVDKDASVFESAAKLESNQKVLPFATDVTSSKDVEKTVAKTIDEFGRIDILVNCAGIALMAKAEEFPEEYWDATLDVNLKGVFLMSTIVGKEMIKAGGGKIVNIASQAGVIAIEEHLAYTASKAGVIGLTKVLALEWGRYNINVNALSPTIVMTELGKSVWQGEKGELAKKSIPVKRFAEPDEIAAAILYLSSDAAAMVSGSNLMIDGGNTIW